MVGLGPAQLLLAKLLGGLRSIEFLGRGVRDPGQVLEAPRRDRNLLKRSSCLDPRWLTRKKGHLCGSHLLLENDGHGLAPSELP